MGNLVLTGATSGSATVQATDAATVTITLPATSGTLALTSGGGSPTYTTITTTNDASISGLTVGKGGGAVATGTALGYQALNLNSSGAYNTTVGYQAGYATTGGYNTAFGGVALKANTSGVNNVALGAYALFSNTTANSNTAVGLSAMESNTTGANNVSVGLEALKFNTTGGSATAVGYQAAYNATGGFITAVGHSALKANTSSQNNTAVGFQALLSNTTGDYNTAIGTQAGQTTTTGSGNIFIGVNAQGSAATNNNEMVIGGANIIGKGQNTGLISNGNGPTYQGNNSSTWATTSDQRLKKNIVTNNIGLDVINAIQVRNFEYRLPEEITELSQNNAINIEGTQLGVIAQEIQQVLPNCVKQESTGVLRVDTDNLTWYLINAVKELNDKVTALGAK
jgi:hypothetical protein